MKLLINQLKVPLTYDDAILKRAAASMLKCSSKRIVEIEVCRRSIDARSRSNPPVYVIQALATTDFSEGYRNNNNNIRLIESSTPIENPIILTDNSAEVSVIGAGPAGLFAALTLAEAGLKPTLYERGSDSRGRVTKVGQFWQAGRLDSEDNVLYGEGGAGLFSDGKLTARSKDNLRMEKVFSTLTAAGATNEICIDALPHIGSDLLLQIIPEIRQKIIAAGGKIEYNSTLTDIKTADGAITEIAIDGEWRRCDQLLLAIGHSARDTYKLLDDRGIALEQKSFAAGIRVEFPQSQLNASQWGKWASLPELKAATFRLIAKENKNSRACYSFCMCPGGEVISCASEPGYFTSNGMSLSARDGKFCNAAFLVPVSTDDFNDKSNLSGVDWQREIEQRAFNATDGTYALATCRLEDFLAGRVSKSLPNARSCKNSIPADFDKILPKFITSTLRQQLPVMLRKLSKVKLADVLLYAPETRSSAPLRIVRDEFGQSVNCNGLYPSGEGAGYAGGIVSSAVDGIKSAELLIKKLGK